MNTKYPGVPTFAILALAGFLAMSCQPEGGEPNVQTPAFTIDFEKYELENGLDVVLHVDRSDPLVAVAMTYHVGSSREVPGKTGFAHLFEHLLFLNSENLGPGGLDVLIDKLGGTLNGFTTRDQTSYYQVVPRDGLEKVLWAEADKLGYFINTVTDATVAKEKQVVKNEKRQSYDNQPYGHLDTVVNAALYPEDHPYNWPVIGSLEDLDAATLDDARDFYNRWYAPNNATLVVAGDFDVDDTRAWIGKYFGEVPSRELPEIPEPPSVELSESIFLSHADALAAVPDLSMTWPTVPLYHPDSYPLQLLGRLLGDGKRSPFYQVIVEELELAPSVGVAQSESELAGEFYVQIRAFDGIDLDDVREGIDAAFRRFEEEGFTAEDLDRVKAGFETSFYGRLSSALGKAFDLAQYNIFAGDPAYVTEDIERLLGVTAEDVQRVWAEYVQGRPFVATSFVPEGQGGLMLEGSTVAEVAIEPIVTGAEAELALPPAAEVPRTPSSFDRSVEPPFGESPSLAVPGIWSVDLSNGARVLGIENDEIPLVQFAIWIKGGQLMDSLDLPGVANLTAAMMTEGTAGRTPEDLEEAIDALGSSINVSAGPYAVSITGTSLRRNLGETMALVEEILLEPRWDEEEFERVREEIVNGLRQQAGQPTAIASNTYRNLIYGDDHIYSANIRGSIASLEDITIEDLRAFYEANFSPSLAAIHIVGDVGQADAVPTLARIEERWTRREVGVPEFAAPIPAETGAMYFVDVPGASQSVILAGRMAMAETDEDYYPATVMNLRLGGMFTSRLNQTLREERGYTYGASSGFSGSLLPGPLTVQTSVRSNVTMESVDLIWNILSGYPDEFDQAELEIAQGYLVRSNALAFETLGNKIAMLRDISVLGLPEDFVERREAVVRQMTVDRVRELAVEYANPETMTFLIVGDRETQMPRLRELGLVDPVLIEGVEP